MRAKVAASALAVRLGVAEKPPAYSWRQLAGAGALAGIGFTMSLFIAGLAFGRASSIDAAKIGILIASLLAVFALWSAGVSAQTIEILGPPPPVAPAVFAKDVRETCVIDRAMLARLR